MPSLNFIRSEITRMRGQVNRQRKDILTLQGSNISTESAIALLQRMQAKVEALCADRDRLIEEEKLKGPTYASGKRIYGTPARRRA